MLRVFHSTAGDPSGHFLEPIGTYYRIGGRRRMLKSGVKGRRRMLKSPYSGGRRRMLKTSKRTGECGNVRQTAETAPRTRSGNR